MAARNSKGATAPRKTSKRVSPNHRSGGRELAKRLEAGEKLTRRETVTALAWAKAQIPPGQRVVLESMTARLALPRAEWTRLKKPPEPPPPTIEEQREEQRQKLEKQLLDAADASTHASFVFDAIKSVIDEESNGLSEQLSYLIGFASEHGASLLDRAGRQLTSALREIEQPEKGASL